MLVNDFHFSPFGPLIPQLDSTTIIQMLCQCATSATAAALFILNHKMCNALTILSSNLCVCVLKSALHSFKWCFVYRERPTHSFSSMLNEGFHISMGIYFYMSIQPSIIFCKGEPALQSQKVTGLQSVGTGNKMPSLAVDPLGRTQCCLQVILVKFTLLQGILFSCCFGNEPDPYENMCKGEGPFN